ncbi:ATP-binding protein [Candidatus Nomurabacteria bacterium]|nr:ATP-binding protein [Candidatus Nomurabacteria bacterium]
MKKENKILVMFVGKTYSGKTTLAQKIKNELGKMLVLESDPIAAFMKEKFPELRKNDNEEHAKLFNNLKLKFRTFLSFVEFALSLGQAIILSNGSVYKNGRKFILDLSKRFDYKVIGIYFDFPEEVLFDRAKNSNRSLNILRTSKDFNALIINQRTRMQPPDTSEFDDFWVIKSEQDLFSVKDKLVKLLL